MEPKVKVTKGGFNKKLPEDFIKPLVGGSRDKKLSQRPPAVKQKQSSSTQQKQQQKKSPQQQKQQMPQKKSRNPFIPMRQWLKMSKQMDDKLNEARQGLQSQKLFQLNFQNHPNLILKQQFKYQNCLTLNIIKKNNNTCLKKILHVPTFKLYFLRQSKIYFSIDRNDLQDWINKCNVSANGRENYARPQKIIQLYWNIPQSYYSIIYQYADGVLFDVILQNTAIFPLQFIQNMALSHLKADFQIYNSILIIKRNPQSDICYLPVYQQADDIIPLFRVFRQLLKLNNNQQQNQDIKKIQQKMVARLGLLILVTYFGQTIVNQSIDNILFESKDCCLFHGQMNNPSSLIKIFFDMNISSQIQKQIITDILCKILRYKPEQRSTFSQLIKHKFFKTKFNRQICKMNQIILMLQSSGISISGKNPSKQLSEHKMNKILQGIQLILRGTTQIQKNQLNFNINNQNIKFLLNQLGLNNNQNQFKQYSIFIIKKLKNVYDI